MTHGIDRPALDASALDGLAREWDTLRSLARAESAIKSLAQRIVAHRARLFDANASLQADATSDDDVGTIAQIDANQRAIKQCTTMLTEMTSILGHASIPS